ncbi:N-formylglutamate deformylase [Pelagibius sp.]|uniref:N-formylglutamate deformylase n=1 Tax=Pelagibius sp. TaxID=1931238 RepID=UPI003BAE673E
MTPVEIVQGEGPIILGMPHTGTWIPDAIVDKLTPQGQLLADADWHIDRLYDGLLNGATTVRATYHRYVIDPNRPPTDESLYPGQNTTGLIPLTDFDGQPLWLEPPSVGEIEARKVDYHRPYHAALAAQLDRVKALHGFAILYDCHSIRPHIPFLFEGQLPDFNIGTASGQSCAAEMEEAVTGICQRATGYSTVLNGRFKGGWTTRHYGRPADRIHAIQMELSQSTYLKSATPPSFAYDTQKAEQLRTHLHTILDTLQSVALKLQG